MFATLHRNQMVECGQVVGGTRVIPLFVSNNYDKNIKSINDLKDKGIRFTLGETATVPVGQYSK